MALEIIFKTKSGPQQGMGDVTSSLALADEFKLSKPGKILFITNADKAGTGLISDRGYEHNVIEDKKDMELFMGSHPADIAVLNQLDTSLDEAAIFKWHSKMLVTIEDAGEAAKIADMRFNVLYPQEGALTDFDFIPLSSDFGKKHLLPKTIKKRVRNILVTQGGSDTYGFTIKIIRSLYGIRPDISIKVVIGPNFLFEEELSNALKISPRRFEVIRGVSDISDIIRQADMGVSAAGNTLFEFACLGVPVVVVCGEVFESGTAERLQKDGFGINLGFGKNVSESEIFKAANELMNDFDLRMRMSKTGKSLVTGQGARRAAEKIISFYQDKYNA